MDTPHPAQARRASGAVTALIGLTAVAIVFLFNTNVFTTHWYALFKVVHVTGAVAWVGGGLTLTILGMRTERSNDPGEMATIARQVAFVGEWIFAPIGLIVFLAGIAMVINLDLGWGTSWIVVGLVGYAITFLTGFLVLSPLAKRVAPDQDEGRRGGRDAGGDPADPADRTRRHRGAPARRRRHCSQAVHLVH